MFSLFIKNFATNNMFKFTIPPRSVEGGVFNGNMASQNNNATNWWSCIDIAPADPSIEYPPVSLSSITFTNHVFAGVRVEQARCDIDFLYNNFYDAKEHGGVLGLQSEAVNIVVFYCN
jgi:hypothetical protein